MVPYFRIESSELDPKETFANKVVELSAKKLGSDMGKAVRTELEEALKNLGGGIARKLHVQLDADGKDRNPEKIAELENALATKMATKIVDRIIVQDLQGKTIIAAPAILRKIATELSRIDEVALGKITSSEITEVIASSAGRRASSATEDPDTSPPKAAPRPRPQTRSTSSSSGSWSSGGKGRSSGGK